MIRAHKYRTFTELSDDLKVLNLDGEFSYVLFFEADWSGPSYLLKPVLIDLAKEYKEVLFIKINAEEKKDLLKHFNIVSLPTLLFFKHNKELDRIVGYTSIEKIEDKIEVMLNNY